MKQDLIDWLIQNEAEVKDCIKDVNSRMTKEPIEILFSDEIKDQWFQEVKNEIMNNISKCLAIPNEIFHEYIEDEFLKTYLERIQNG